MLLAVFKHLKSTCAIVLKAIYPKTQWQRQTGESRSLFPLSNGEWSQTNATEKLKGPQLASPSLIPIHSTLETISLFLQEFQLILQITMSTFKYEW